MVANLNTLPCNNILIKWPFRPLKNCRGWRFAVHEEMTSALRSTTHISRLRQTPFAGEDSLTIGKDHASLVYHDDGVHWPANAALCYTVGKKIDLWRCPTSSDVLLQIRNVSETKRFLKMLMQKNLCLWWTLLVNFHIQIQMLCQKEVVIDCKRFGWDGHSMLYHVAWSLGGQSLHCEAYLVITVCDVNIFGTIVADFIPLCLTIVL